MGRFLGELASDGKKTVRAEMHERAARKNPEEMKTVFPAAAAVTDGPILLNFVAALSEELA